jgi:hypothetical protein
MLALAALAGAALAGWWALRARRRRLFRETMTGASGETPAFRVTVLDSAAGRVKVRVTLYGAAEGLDVVRLTAPASAAARARLGVPAGFALDPAGSAEEPGASCWRPVSMCRVEPGGSLELEWAYDANACVKPVAVHGWAERRTGRERVRAGFVVLVGPRAADEVEAANLRSALYAEARERGMVPHTLPAWRHLEELERRRPGSDTERTRTP